MWTGLKGEATLQPCSNLWNVSYRSQKCMIFTDLRLNKCVSRSWTGVCTGWAIMTEQHNHFWRTQRRSRVNLERWQIMKTAITSPIIFHQPFFLVLIFHIIFSWTDTKSTFAQLSVCYGFDKMPPANLICQVHILITEHKRSNIFTILKERKKRQWKIKRILLDLMHKLSWS